MLELNTININNIPEQIGIYKIFVKNEQLELIQISRFCNQDPMGLLYIGRTDKQNLKVRLYQFYASAHAEMETHNHSGGQKYFKNETIRNYLNSHSLWFEYEIVNTPREREEELLNEYANIYGEYPPLNR